MTRNVMPLPAREADQGSEPAESRPDKPRLLFLCQTLPYPPDTGVAVRCYNILRQLAEGYSVTALCFHRQRAIASPESLGSHVDAMKEVADTTTFPIPEELSRLRYLWTHLRSVLRRRVYTYYAYESAEFTAHLKELLAKERFDVVQIDSLDLLRYIPLLPDIPIVCTHHSVESQLLRRRAAVESSMLRKLYLSHQADLYERAERYWCKRFALNITVSEADKDLLSELAPEGRFVVVPNGVDVEYFQPGTASEESLVFLGGLEMFPNRDALNWFADEILPLIRARGIDPAVYWVGRSTVDEQRYYRERYGIDLTGYVDDIRPYVHRAACCVVPLRIGGGTRLKITTAWAMGKAIISTSLGAEGLVAVDGSNILIRDSPEAFAAAVQRTLSDAALRSTLERGARKTAESYYSWDVIGEAMRGEYRRVGYDIEPGELAGVTR